MTAHKHAQEPATSVVVEKGEFWTANAIFFIAMHIIGLAAFWIKPPSTLPRATLLMLPLLWQAAVFGITVGYHRLWSHRAFRAGTPVRVALAFCGAMGFQGSIKVRCLRHRLHHRFTDDPVHDPYAVTRGMFFAHMGWIFWKPSYPRMSSIGREDLDRDPIVRFQHKYYVPIALFSGLIFPTLLGALWGDALGMYLYGGVVVRVIVWHCTFIVNSFAHWNGLQPYSDEVTARGNMLLAMLTGGEGNHNFVPRTRTTRHAFPHDFRAGLRIDEWDPSKWLLLFLHRFGLVWGLRRAREADISWAVKDMRRREEAKAQGLDPDEVCNGSDTDEGEQTEWNARAPGRCLLVIDGYVVDATKFMGDHPGGASLIRNYAVRDADKKLPSGQERDVPIGDWREATWAYHGGLNNHSRAATRRLRQLRIARFDDGPRS
ncbi:hypothetical protein EXIGLDRAFT_604374 [Exidia glandulosa HHB12029]|uniref:Acyl-CoA desaturase n=1 Tax=Exidia glandulosa HHB12029 TaxID=1314781 RepID=A0A165N9W9_EXIGL|nr:hypothetical protein EXIGLDRAFT_604374 [Exidia glandulosa HHB12029]